MDRKERHDTRQIAVWVITAHPLVVQFLEGLLAKAPKIHVTHEMVSTIRRRKEHTRSVLILDQGSLSIDFAKYLHELRSSFPSTKLLITGARVANEELCRLLFLGVHGFVPYDAARTQLADAIRAVSDGHLWVPHEVLEEFAQQKQA